MKINNSRETIHLGAETEREILLITMEGKLHVIYKAKGDTAPKKTKRKQNKQTSHSLMNEFSILFSSLIGTTSNK